MESVTVTRKFFKKRYMPVTITVRERGNKRGKKK
jgi:hypothetical protein